MAEVVVAEVEAKTEELLAPEDATEVVDTDRPPNAEPPKTDEVAGFVRCPHKMVFCTKKPP